MTFIQLNPKIAFDLSGKSLFDVTAPEVEYHLSPELHALCHALEQARPAAEMMSELRPAQRRAAELLLAEQVLVTSERPLQRALAAEALDRFGRAGAGPAEGEVLTPLQLLGCFALPDLPADLRELLAAGEAMEHRAVCYRLNRVTTQWNPYSGHWYFDLRALPRTTASQRWLSELRSVGAEAVVNAVHEVVHGMVSVLGLLGALKRLSPRGLDVFHRVGEGLAYLVGDMVLPARLERERYWDGYWPAAAERSHAHVYNPTRAGRAIELPHDRYVRAVYFGEDDPPMSRAMAAGGLAELCDLVMVERRYAHATRVLVNQAWNRNYWRARALEEFRAKFLSAAGVRIEGVAVRTPGQVFANWERAVFGWRDWFQPATQLRGQLAILRLALKVAELRKAIDSERLMVTSELRVRGQRRLLEEWDALLKASIDAQRADDGEVSERIEARRMALSEELAEIFGGSFIWFRYPNAEDAMGGLAMAVGQATGIDGVSAAVDAIREEALAIVDLSGASARLEQLCGEAAAWAARLHGAGPDARRAGKTAEEGQRWAAEQLATGAIVLPYDLRWMVTRRQIDPSTGFRFT